MDCSTVVIGAGAAGLAVAAGLTEKGLDVTLVERGASAGWSWVNRYDRLRLHTAKNNSFLPGKPFPAAYPKFIPRDQLVDYYKDYARARDFDIRFDHRVTDVRRRPPEGWEVAGKDWSISAKNLVVATGYSHTPCLPEIKGLDSFNGDVRHSADYRNAGAYRGKRVLVVGMGNSGAEIALDLAENGAQPTLSVRSPVVIIPREVFGVSADTIAIKTRHTPPRIADRLNWPLRRLLIGSYKGTGLRVPDYGPMTMIAKRKRIPVIDVGTLAKIRSGAIAVKPGIARFEDNSAVFTDGDKAEFDAIILATGFSTGLGALFGRFDGVLDEREQPLVSGGKTREPGLYFCGYNVTAGGMLREIRHEAQNICALIESSKAALPA